MGLIIHAPNVHVGGGLVLLQQLLRGLQRDEVQAILDTRAKANLEVPKGLDKIYFPPSIIGRLNAELELRRRTTKNDIVLCFHSMPPLLPVVGHVTVFQQNRHLLGLGSLEDFPLWPKIRIVLERIICRMFQHRVDHFLVQTPAMQRDIKQWQRNAAPVTVLPFLNDGPRFIKRALPITLYNTSQATYDFIYVASGDTHKNHRKLIEAWEVLAQEGIYPSLVLTVDELTNRALCQLIADKCKIHRLKIVNVGHVSRAEVMALYEISAAVIFPSTSESFGIPLIEARSCGLPVLASELDFVRDLLDPEQSFDPHSAISIARAVKRFLGIQEQDFELHTSGEFLECVRTGGGSSAPAS